MHTQHKRIACRVLAIWFFALVALALPGVALADEGTAGGMDMYRLYNPNSGEHFYTANAAERSNLVSEGWRYEGIGWVAPSEGEPVYRLYSGTDHHYTVSAEERDWLEAQGWSYEGVGWYSGGEVALLRQFNPNVDPSASYNNSGSHNYTTSESERDLLVSSGWNAEGVGWYALEAGRQDDANALIMGVPTTSPSAMAAFYRSKAKPYPSTELGKGGAPTIDDFATLVFEEAEMEGVRPEVVFCQSMLETGWLQFGGDVKVEQFNFAGLGATGGGVAGASFADVRTGIRAQVQHLKAYASTQPLVTPCVDPRFHLVTRGIAPEVTDLNGRWAVPGTNYGQTILSLMGELSNFS
jgi:hypothetical protein